MAAEDEDERGYGFVERVTDAVLYVIGQKGRAVTQRDVEEAIEDTFGSTLDEDGKRRVAAAVFNRLSRG